MLTKKEIVAEILKSGKNPDYFINNYVKISHPIEGLIPFKTYDFQTQLLDDFNDYRFNVILKDAVSTGTVRRAAIAATSAQRADAEGSPELTG